MGAMSEVKCQVCGAPAQAGSSRCAYCGNELPVQQAPAPAPAPAPFKPRSFGQQPGQAPFRPPAPAPIPPPVIRRPGRSGSPVALIVLAMGVVAVGGVGAVFFMLRSSGPSSTPSSYPPQTPAMPWSAPVAPASPTAPLQVAQPVRGIFSPGLPVDGGGYPHIDYTLTITTPGSFTIDLMSENTSAYDPYLRLLANGQEIAHDDDGGDGSLQSRITQPLGPGTYTVRVSKFGASQVSNATGFTLAVMGPPQPAVATSTVPSTTPGGSSGQVVINESQIVVTGGLQQSVITPVVTRQMGSINACYARALVRNPSLTGTVLFRFEVTATGRVSSVTVASTTLGDNVAVTNCITASIRRFRFPATGGAPAVVMLPMDFRSS